MDQKYSILIDKAPDLEEEERQVSGWRSGELFGYYYDWFFHDMREIVFECGSGGIPHQHCMDIMLVEKTMG